MPADADLLCEFYLSSQLGGSSSKTAGLQQPRGGAFNHQSSSSSSFTVDTIDFVKYTKNPMSDGLKLKYELLAASSGNHHHNNNSSSSTNSNGTQTITTTNIAQQQPQQQSSLVSTISAASNGIKSAVSSPVTSNGVPLNGHTIKLSPTNGTSPPSVNGSNGKTVNHNNNNTNGTSHVANCLDLSWSRIRKTGIGLYNLGNNCYLNATLQCLAYTAPFSQWLVTRPHSPACRFRMLKGFCSLCEVERIVFDIFNAGGGGGYGCAKPNNLCYNIKKISNVFGVGTQEDASEFLTTLLENMAKAIKFSNPQQQQQHQNHQQQIQMMKKAAKNHTILDDIFAFQFRSRITCSSCGRLSDTIEDANIWPLEVKYVQDIRKGMLHFLKEEILDGENAYKCEKCGRKTRATKKYSIRSAPNILVIHLKRFDSTHAGKLSHYVAYPELLSLPESLTGNNVQYRLYGVLVHLGYTSHSGHYYAYVRAPNGQQWHKADDTSVSTVSSHDALAQNAYILFYSKISQPPSDTAATNNGVASAAAATTGVAMSKPQPQPAATNSTPPMQLPRSILLNGSFKNPQTTTTTTTTSIPVATNGSNGTNGTSHSLLNHKNEVTSSTTSNYLNGICVGKRPSTTPGFIPRIIKADETGPSPAKMPRVEYGPQLPPSLRTSNNNNNNSVSPARQSPPKSSPSSDSSSNGKSLSSSMSPKTNGLNGHHMNGKDQNGKENIKEEKVESTTTTTKKPKSSKKKLRRKRLKKLIKQVRQGRVRPDELTEKQLKYAKTKKEKKRLKKAFKKAAAAAASSSKHVAAASP